MPVVMANFDPRAYITVEESLTKRLVNAWHQQAGPAYAAIAAACRDQKWNEARRIATDLDLTDVGTQNREWIKYHLLLAANYGARMVANADPSFVGVGSFDSTLNQVTDMFLQYLEYAATRQVVAEAMQLIAEDEQKTKAAQAQKQEHQYGTTQIDIWSGSSLALSMKHAREQIDDADCMAQGKDVEGDHITIRYGLQSDDVDALRVYLASLTPFVVTAKRVLAFEPSEHSDGAAPIVVEIDSPDLHRLHEDIEAHADFKESSFATYIPHASVAYVTPESASKYTHLQVSGSYRVDMITISHRTGVREIIPLSGMPRHVAKADKSGRYVTPFVSFHQHGSKQLQLIASLNSSRLATWGFTAEAHVRGVTRYKLSATLDGGTSKFCRMINGREFDVVDAREKVIEALNVQNPDDLRVVQPWPKQTKAAIAAYAAMSSEELTEQGLHIPPFHPRCRTMCRMIGSKDKAPAPVKPGVQLQPVLVSVDTFKEMGLTQVTPEQVDYWNAHVGVNPVQLLETITGKTAQEILAGAFGKNAIGFDGGNIHLKMNGILKDVKYATGVTLDPYSGTLYLTQADLIEGTIGQEAAFMRRLLGGLIEGGDAMGATSFVVSVGEEAAAYVKMGFLPSQEEWDTIRERLLQSIADGDLASVFAEMTTEDRLLVDHLLQSNDVENLIALAQLTAQPQGKTIIEWLLADVKGNFTLDLTNPMAIAQAQAYVKAL